MERSNRIMAYGENGLSVRASRPRRVLGNDCARGRNYRHGLPALARSVPVNMSMTHPRKSHGAVRYAVVGQGYIAQAAVLPAFAHAKRNSRLAAIVSGDAVKRRELG